MPSRSTRETLATLETRMCRVEEQISTVARAVESLNDTLGRVLLERAPGHPTPPGLVAGTPQVVNHFHLAADAGKGVTTGITAAVTFSDVALIAAAVKPPFGNDEGDYADPDLVIAGGEVPGDVPDSIGCPSAYVIYSSWAEVVPNCQGFGGPNDGNNAVVRRARRNAQRVADRIDCEDDCRKTVVEIWRGWSCGGNPQPVVATAAVELKVLCSLDVEA